MSADLVWHVYIPLIYLNRLSGRIASRNISLLIGNIERQKKKVVHLNQWMELGKKKTINNLTKLIMSLSKPISSIPL